MLKRINEYFGIREKNSSLQIELLAGLSTFLSLSYIFVVNPAILAQAGMNKSAVLFATIITSGLATIIMGLWARLPFALAPGMEMNAYVAFFVVGSLGFTWQQALGAVFWSGVIFVVLTITRVRQKIIDAIPERMKASLSFSVGVFLGLVALKIAGILIYDGVKLRGLGSFTTPIAYALYLSFVIVMLLDWLKVRGAVLISIILTSIFCFVLGINIDSETSAAISSEMFSHIGHLDIGVIANPKILSVILILFLIDFYGSVAKLIGLTAKTNIMIDKQLPRSKEALLVDGAATGVGSILGTSSITVYVESGVGIETGGRTGFTSVVCGVLMLSCFALTPVLKFVPVIATTGVLLFVGIKLCPSFKELKSYPKGEIIVLALMQVIVMATFAIDRAMLAGFFVYLVSDLIHLRRPNLYLLISTIFLFIGFVLQWEL